MNSFNKGGGNGGRVKGLDRNNGNLEVREEILSRKKREKDVVISEREVNGGSEGDAFRWSKVFIVDQRRRGEFLFSDILFRKKEFFFRGDKFREDGTTDLGPVAPTSIKFGLRSGSGVIKKQWGSERAAGLRCWH